MEKIDKSKVERVTKPFKDESNWLTNAYDSVKEFFTPEGPSYNEKVSQGLKDFKAKKTGVESIPLPTATPTPEPTLAPVGMSDERRQKLLAKQFMLNSLGLMYELTPEDDEIEDLAEDEEPALIAWGSDKAPLEQDEDEADDDDDDFIDIDFLEV